MAKPTNIIVTERDLHNNRRRKSSNKRHSNSSQAEISEQLIRKFIKKCKKERVVKEYVEKTAYYKSKSQKKKEKRNRAIKRLSRKVNKPHKFKRDREL